MHWSILLIDHIGHHNVLKSNISNIHDYLKELSIECHVLIII